MSLERKSLVSTNGKQTIEIIGKILRTRQLKWAAPPRPVLGPLYFVV